ncbi:MAG: PilW family protein [Methylovulum sp.]|nr:PilW family protein [Methylovulum sp.]
MKRFVVRRNQGGMSLIELMVAMLIGLFLLGGILQIFTSSRQAYRIQDNLAHLQEDGRFALDFIANDVRMADFWECRAVSPVAANPANTLSGTDATGPNNADSITVVWRTGTWVGATCTDTLPDITVTYWIQASTSGNGTSLWRIITGGQPVELIEGVENMQILYGEDINGPDNNGYYTPNYYVPSGLVTNMGNVVSIRISLLLATLDNVATSPVLYNYNGVSDIDPGDLKMRRVYTGTIALRNRLR